MSKREMPDIIPPEGSTHETIWNFGEICYDKGYAAGFNTGQKDSLETLKQALLDTIEIIDQKMLEADQ